MLVRFLTFGHMGLQKPIFGLKQLCSPNKTFFGSKMGFPSHEWPKVRKQTIFYLFFYIFQGVSKYFLGPPSTLSRYHIVHISKRANPSVWLNTFLKTLDHPQKPCEGIFHGGSLLELSVARTGVCLNVLQAKSIYFLLVVPGQFQ